MPISAEFQAHLATGLTSVARCWALTRRDGLRQGFTDHDRDISFDDLVFRADTGLTARAVQQTTGMSIDNTEALGALSASSVTEDDIRVGRYDGANVEAWLVNWAAPDQRLMQFRGTLGEVTRVGGAFRAEMQGLTEALNQAQGRVFQKPCAAVLGDAQCGFDFSVPGYREDRAIERLEQQKLFQFTNFGGFEDRWFERGRLEVLSGAGAGLVGVIKNDRLSDASREIELWQALRIPLGVGDMVRIEAGCDKRASTCRLKFNNFLNFRGYPDMPGEDWLMSYPVRSGANDGGALRNADIDPGELWG